MNKNDQKKENYILCNNVEIENIFSNDMKTKFTVGYRDGYYKK